jgi:colanic acid biosynthesis glycosyl transferase WcaI
MAIGALVPKMVDADLDPFNGEARPVTMTARPAQVVPGKVFPASSPLSVYWPTTCRPRLDQMRILVVGINYTPDLIGVAKYNTELCEALVSFGHEVRVVTAPPYYPKWSIPHPYQGWRYRDEAINGVSITRSPIYVPDKPTGAKRLIHHLSFALTSFWPVASIALRWRPDVVFSVAPSLMSASFPAWIARRIGALSWLHLQDFEVDAAFDLGLLSYGRAPMEAVERTILRSFDCVSTISPPMLDRLAAKGVDKEKTREVRNWTDTAQIVPGNRQTRFRKELHLDDSHFVGLYSGTMSNKQGLELIIEAASSLDQTDRKVRFIMCGDGPYKTELQNQAAGLSNVLFLGLQTGERFAELLRTADFHLIPQRAEAADLVLPSKLGSIFATGRPAIVMANPQTGLASEVTGAGLIIQPGNVPALAAAVRSLAGSSGLCDNLGEGARKIALLRWDKTAILGALEHAIVSAIEFRKSGLSGLPPLVEKGPARAK